MSVIVTLAATVPPSTGATITVFEDLDNDGTAENQGSKAITGSGTYVFDGLDGASAADYWIQFDLESSDENESPRISSATLNDDPPMGVYVNAHLQGQSATATVFEDLDNDGTAENQQQVTLQDGPTHYTLNQLDLTLGADYWIQFSLNTSDQTRTPMIDSATVILPDVEFIHAQAATINLSGPNASVSAGDSSIQADAGVITLVPPDGSVSPGAASIQAQPATLDVSGQDAAAVVPGEATISADAADLQITAENAGRVFDSAHLAGAVTLNGTGVEGAEVYAIDDVESFGGVGSTNTEEFSGVATLSDSNGDYTIRVEAGQEWMLAYSYEDGQGNQYNALSKPFLVP